MLPATLAAVHTLTLGINNGASHVMKVTTAESNPDRTNTFCFSSDDVARQYDANYNDANLWLGPYTHKSKRKQGDGGLAQEVPVLSPSASVHSCSFWSISATWLSCWASLGTLWVCGSAPDHPAQCSEYSWETKWWLHISWGLKYLSCKHTQINDESLQDRNWVVPAIHVGYTWGGAGDQLS